jgi:hypothetical protein
LLGSSGSGFCGGHFVPPFDEQRISRCVDDLRMFPEVEEF